MLRFMGRYPGRRASAQRVNFNLDMLRITTFEKEASFVVTMEGRLCGAWVAEAHRTWSQLRERANGHEIILELGGVTFIDSTGEMLLAEILLAGAQVHSNGVLITHIVDRMRTDLGGCSE
jgi:anti-anti-sigma factor